MPPSWALFGTPRSRSHLDPELSEHNYWCGWVAACGGALAFGGVRADRRGMAASGTRSAIRRFVGPRFSATAGLVPRDLWRVFLCLRSSLSGLFQARAERPVVLRRTVATVGAVCVLGAAWMALNRPASNRQSLGDAVCPSRIDVRDIKPTFIWQRARSVLPYRHAPIRDYQVEELKIYRREHTLFCFCA